MSSYLTDGIGYAETGEFTIGDLADEYGFEPEDGDINEVIDRLVIALMQMDRLQGDDPTKFAAFEDLVTALKILEDAGDGEIRGSFDWSDGQLAVEKIER